MARPETLLQATAVLNDAHAATFFIQLELPRTPETEERITKLRKEMEWLLREGLKMVIDRI